MRLDSDTCKVTLKTRRNIRRITQRDASGEIVKRWSTRKGESVRLFSDFDKFPIALTEGTIKVKTGYRDKVKFQEIGDEFRADLIDCLTVEPEPGCPVSSEIVEFLNEQPVPNFIDPLAGVTVVDPSVPVATFTADPIVVQDNGFFCELMNPTGNSILIDTVQVEGTATHSISFDGSGLNSSLTLDQARACADEAGCSNFNGETIPGPNLLCLLIGCI